jgi:hypothetical protein
LAHLLNPHYPYVFDAGCQPHHRRPTGSRGRGRRQVLDPESRRRKQSQAAAAAYVDQVRCLNTLLLRTVTTVLQRSTPAPIVLLVGDHGTSLLGYFGARTAEAVSPAQARERFGIWGPFSCRGPVAVSLPIL